MFGPYYARGCTTLTWFLLNRRVLTLSNQSGIESCRGRFTDLNRRLRQLPMQNYSKAQMRFGASQRPTHRKATYLALRPIGITCRMVSAASISIPWSALLREVGAPLMHGGILEPRAFYKEPTLLEQFAPLSSCLDSLTGSHNPLDGAIR